MAAGAPLRASAFQGFLYTTIVGLLLFWSYMQVDSDLRDSLYKKFCDGNVSKMLHEDAQTLKGFGKTFAAAHIPLGAGTDLILSVQEAVCDDFQTILNFIDTSLFALLIVKAVTWVFYAIVLWEPTMINKSLINACLVAYLGSVVLLTLVVACILDSRVLQFAERVIGLETSKRDTPEMLLAAVVLGGLFELVGFLTYAVAVSSIDPAEMVAAETLADRTLMVNPETNQLKDSVGSAAMYGVTKKLDGATNAPYMGTAATVISSY